MRWYSNTLQAIAVGYVVSALVLTIRRAWVRVTVPFALLALYGVLLHFGGDYSKLGNLAPQRMSSGFDIIFATETAVAETAVAELMVAEVGA